MLKKVVIGSAVLLGVGTLVGGTSAFSYVKTGYHSVRDSIKDQIPIDLEIKRVRDMIHDLEPEVTDNTRVIAREEVAVAKLKGEIQEKESKLSKSKEAIFRLKGDLQSGVKYVSYGGRAYDMDQVKKDLNDRFKNFQSQEAIVKKMNEILEAREANLDAARRKLDAMLAAKRQYEVAVENLQARLTMQQVAGASSQYSLSDSSLKKVRESLDDISTRIDVAEKLVNIDSSEVGIPVLEETTPVDLVEQITNYFDNASVQPNVLVEN